MPCSTPPQPHLKLNFPPYRWSRLPTKWRATIGSDHISPTVSGFGRRAGAAAGAVGAAAVPVEPLLLVLLVPLLPSSVVAVVAGTEVAGAAAAGAGEAAGTDRAV